MVRIPVRASEFFRSQKLPVFPHCVMMDVIFGKIGSFSPNQKSGVCIIEMVAGRIGRKPFKGISVALHHHFWRQKGDPPQCLLLAATWKIPHPNHSQPVQHTTQNFPENSSNFSIIAN